MKIQVLVIPLFILFLSSFAFAQNLDGVELNDGTLIYGDVNSRSQNSKWINIKKKDGSIETIKRDDVLRFLNNEHAEGTLDFTDSNTARHAKNDYLKKNNIMIKLGAYSADNDIKDVDTGFFGQITYNRYFNENFAFEVGGGTISTSATTIFTDSSNNEIIVDGDLAVINFILNLKLVYPTSFGEIYAGAGPGVYMLYGDDNATSITIDDTDTVFGGQVIAGINFNINSVLFLGVEGQYIFTKDATFSGTYSKTFNMNGYNISGVIGFRF